MVMLRDDGNSGLLLRLTGADDDSLVGCCCGNVNDLALVTVDTPSNRSCYNVTTLQVGTNLLTHLDLQG